LGLGDDAPARVRVALIQLLKSQPGSIPASVSKKLKEGVTRGANLDEVAYVERLMKLMDSEVAENGAQRAAAVKAEEKYKWQRLATATPADDYNEGEYVRRRVAELLSQTNIEEAKRLYYTRLAHVQNDAFSCVWLAGLCAATGETREAINLLDAAQKLGFADVDVFGNPAFAPLQESERFFGHDTGVDQNHKTISAADFNEDGKLDAIVGGSESLQLLVGNGNGTFVVSTLLPNLAGADQITGSACTDMNGDGNADAVVLQGGPPYKIMRSASYIASCGIPDSHS
jgi:hypothetical protein